MKFQLRVRVRVSGQQRERERARVGRFVSLYLTYRVMMVDMMLVMMVLGAMIGLLIVRAQLEEMRQGRKEEE